MCKTVLLFLLIVGLTSARDFINPVIDGLDTPDPGVVFYNGLYYAATTANNVSPMKFPIHTSPDLQNWTFAGYIFEENSRPIWSTDVEYWAPEIHIIGDGQFRAYFTTRDRESGRLAIGAAFSTNILGPYHALDRPLVLDLSQDVLDATLINYNGVLYLIWKGAEWMYGRLLNNDGLSFDSEEVHLVMRNDLPWEEFVVEAPWFVQRNGYFYMFYSGNGFCGDRYAVGIARSLALYGPYEKKGDPIFATDDKFVGPGHCSVVKDLDGVSDVMVFHAYKPGQVCGPFPRVMNVRSVAWSEDGWPYMV